MFVRTEPSALTSSSFRSASSLTLARYLGDLASDPTQLQPQNAGVPPLPLFLLFQNSSTQGLFYLATEPIHT